MPAACWLLFGLTTHLFCVQVHLMRHTAAFCDHAGRFSALASSIRLEEPVAFRLKPRVALEGVLERGDMAKRVSARFPGSLF